MFFLLSLLITLLIFSLSALSFLLVYLSGFDSVLPLDEIDQLFLFPVIILFLMIIIPYLFIFFFNFGDISL